MKLPEFKPEISDILIILFTVSVVVVNAIWLCADTRLPRGNGGEFIVSMGYQITQDGVVLTPRFLQMPVTPYLLEILYFQFYNVFGLFTGKELLGNLIFYVIISLSTYKIGEIIYSKKAGFIASVLAQSYYMVVNMSRSTYREFHLLALVSLTFWLMLKTERFTNMKYCAALGISIGLTLLAKYNAVLYMAPFIIYAIYSWKRDIKGFAIAAGCALAVAGPWYISHMPYVIEMTIGRFIFNQFEIARQTVSIFSLQSLDYHLKALILNNAGPLFGVLFIFATIESAITRKKPEENLLLAVFWLGYAIFALIPIKGGSLLVPLYFASALITAGFVCRLRSYLSIPLAIFIVLSCTYIHVYPFYHPVTLHNYGSAQDIHPTSIDSYFSNLGSPYMYGHVMTDIFRQNMDKKTQLILSPDSDDIMTDWAYLSNIYMTRTIFFMASRDENLVSSNVAYVPSNYRYIDDMSKGQYDLVIRYMPKDMSTLYQYKPSLLAPLQRYRLTGNYSIPEMYIEVYELAGE